MNWVFHAPARAVVDWRGTFMAVCGDTDADKTECHVNELRTCAPGSISTIFITSVVALEVETFHDNGRVLYGGRERQMYLLSAVAIILRLIALRSGAISDFQQRC